MEKINTKLVLQFVIGTFVLSWLAWGIIIFADLEYGTPLFMTLYGVVGGLSPMIVVFTLLIKNKIMPAKQLFKTIFAVKQPVIMYLCVIGFLVLYFGASALLGIVDYAQPIYLSLLMFPFMMVGGGLEEVGWRFLFQPSLERKLSFIPASTIIAIIWITWHLPLFFIKGTHQYTWNFILWALMVFGFCFILGAIHHLSKSVWLCIFFHTLINCLTESFMPNNLENFAQGIIPQTILTVVCITVSIAVVVIVKKRGDYNQK